MKIGILTFHWSTNYGAILQSYALQVVLEKRGGHVNIINYKPIRFDKSVSKCFFSKRPWQIKKNIIDYYKEKSLVPFREKNLKTTDRYESLEELRVNPPDYDIYICGSDQVWNPSFTMNGELRPTTSYFLDFGSENITRIAYAVSFGCLSYSKKIKNIVRPLLSKFDMISVRENSGTEIVVGMGYDNVSIMPDPTLLLSAIDYDNLLDDRVFLGCACFIYIIHDGQRLARKIGHLFRDIIKEKVVCTKSIKYSMIGIEEWLLYIKKSTCVVTNSFHGVVFSIIYKKNFIAIPVEGSGSEMNDRLYTLLNQLSLINRLVDKYDEDSIKELFLKPIDWVEVSKKIKIMQMDADLFFNEAIGIS
jgi:hypothetical protein